jgi:hypothetical protein
MVAWVPSHYTLEAPTWTAWLYRVRQYVRYDRYDIRSLEAKNPDDRGEGEVEGKAQSKFQNLSYSQESRTPTNAMKGQATYVPACITFSREWGKHEHAIRCVRRINRQTNVMTTPTTSPDPNPATSSHSLLLNLSENLRVTEEVIFLNG